MMFRNSETIRLTLNLLIYAAIEIIKIVLIIKILKEIKKLKK